MITERVTPEKLAAWQALYAQYRDSLRPNRISGEELDGYFREKYCPELYDSAAFREVVRWNAQVQYPDAPTEADGILSYRLAGEILVGIDPVTGFFHVECENIGRAVPVWDDLFTARGLDAQDLENYVLTAQYLELTGAGAKEEV